MKLENKIVLGIIITVIIGSIINLAFYYGSLRPYSEVYFPTDFQQNILGIRFVVSIAFLFCLIGILLKSLYGKIFSLVSILPVMYFYWLWYFEKFKWLEIIGLKVGTSEYSNILHQIGWFREANGWDYIVLFSSVVLFFWVIFRYNIKNSKTLQ